MLFSRHYRIRFEGETEGGKKFTGKMSVETIFVNDISDIKKYLRNALYVEYGEKVKSIKILAIA